MPYAQRKHGYDHEVKRVRCIGARSLRTLVRVLLALAVAAAALAIMASGSARADQRSVTVMTQNLYQGTEFPTSRRSRAQTPHSHKRSRRPQLTTRPTSPRVQRPRKLIAAEIAQNKPASSGCRRSPRGTREHSTPAPFALPEPVSEDFTQELIAALAADGIHYAVVSRHDNNFTLAFPIVIRTSEASPPSAWWRAARSSRAVRPAARPAQAVQSPVGHLQRPHAADSPTPWTPTNDDSSSPTAGSRSTSRCAARVPLHHHPPRCAGVGRCDIRAAGPGTARRTGRHLASGDRRRRHELRSRLRARRLRSVPRRRSHRQLDRRRAGRTAAHLLPPGNRRPAHRTQRSAYTHNLDHVFTRGSFSVLNEHLVGNTRPTPSPASFIWPSDHAGMVATLKIGPHG